MEHFNQVAKDKGNYQHLITKGSNFQLNFLTINVFMHFNIRVPFLHRYGISIAKTRKN